MANTSQRKRGKKQEDVRSVSPNDESSEPVAAKVEQAPLTTAEVLADPVLSHEVIDYSKIVANNALLRQQTQPSTQVSKPMSETVSLFEFSQDLSEAEAPAPLPVGEYPATIVKCEIKDSKIGNKYLAVSFRIDPESYPADFDEGNPEGETLTYNRLALLDTPQGRHRARKFNESVGAALGSRIDPNEYMGLTANIGVVHDTWEGEKRAQISKVLSA